MATAKAPLVPPQPAKRANDPRKSVNANSDEQATDSSDTIEVAPVLHKVRARLQEDTVDMVVAVIPQEFKLMDVGHQPTEYKAGTRNIPRAHAEHWYAIANGVKIHAAD